MPDMRGYPRYLPRYSIRDMKNPHPIRSRYPIFRTLTAAKVVAEKQQRYSISQVFFPWTLPILAVVILCYIIFLVVVHIKQVEHTVCYLVSINLNITHGTCYHNIILWFIQFTFRNLLHVCNLFTINFGHYFKLITWSLDRSFLLVKRAWFTLLVNSVHVHDLVSHQIVTKTETKWLKLRQNRRNLIPWRHYCCPITAAALNTNPNPTLLPLPSFPL